jgi:hypothetical protein
MLRKIWFLIISITLFFFLLAGCSSNDTSNAKTVATEFLQKLYTVDSKTADDFSKTVTPKDISSSSNSSQILIDNKALEPVLDSIYSKFKPLSTTSEYNAIISNRTYGDYLTCTVSKDCTIQNETIQLTKDKTDEGYTNFTYVSNFKIVFNKDKKVQKETEKGIITVVKENNLWKVSYIQITTHSDFLSGS